MPDNECYIPERVKQIPSETAIPKGEVNKKLV